MKRMLSPRMLKFNNRMLGMRNSRKNILILLLCLILFSCAKNNVSNSGIEIIPLASFVDKGEYHVERLSDYAKSLHYIPLETNEKSLLEGVYEKKSFFGNGFFYLRSGEEIYKFSDSGKYISKIGTIGNGPGEYIYIRDMDIDFQNEKLYLENHDKELLEYSTNGEYLRSIPIKQDLLEKKYYTWLFKLLSPNLFFFELTSPVDNQCIAMFSDDSFKQMSFIKARNPIIRMEGERTVESNSEIYKSQNDFYLYKPRTDTVYQINADSLDIIPKYVFDYGKYKMSIDNSIWIAQNHKYINLFDLKDPGEYMFMCFDFNCYCPEPFTKKIYRWGEEKEVTINWVYAIYDKKKEMLKLLKQPIPKQLGLLNDLDGGVTFWPGFISSDGKSMFMSCSAETFIETYSGKENLSDEVKAILNQIDEESNPIIVRADL